ncbi:MAG: hypothetical protein AAFU77_15500 [Myxococcota bacterium]
MGFSPANPNQSFSPRAKGQLRVIEPSDGLDGSYVAIGSVNVRVPGSEDSAALAQAKELAWQAGGDVLVITRQGRGSTPIGKGRCLFSRRSRNVSGRVVEECTTYSGVVPKARYYFVAGTVYRADESLAESNAAVSNSARHSGTAPLPTTDDLLARARVARKSKRQPLVVEACDEGFDVACASSASWSRRGDTWGDAARRVHQLCVAGNMYACMILLDPKWDEDLRTFRHGVSPTIEQLDENERSKVVRSTMASCLKEASTSELHARVCGAVSTGFSLIPGATSNARYVYQSNWTEAPLNARELESVSLAACEHIPRSSDSFDRNRSAACMRGAALRHHRGADARRWVAEGEFDPGHGTKRRSDACAGHFDPRHYAEAGCHVLGAADSVRRQQQRLAKVERIRKAQASQHGSRLASPETDYRTGVELLRADPYDLDADWFLERACRARHAQACIHLVENRATYATVTTFEVDRACSVGHTSSCERRLNTLRDQRGRPSTPPPSRRLLKHSGSLCMSGEHPQLCELLAQTYPKPSGKAEFAELAAYQAGACESGKSNYCVSSAALLWYQVSGTQARKRAKGLVSAAVRSDMRRAALDCERLIRAQDRRPIGCPDVVGR